MNRFGTPFFIMLLSLSLADAAGLRILSSMQRQEMIERSRHILEGEFFAPVDIKDPDLTPFFDVSDQFIAGDDRLSIARPLSDDEIFRRLAAAIEPSGSAHRNGQYWLFFGDQMIEVGAVVQVTDAGNVYHVYFDEIGKDDYLLRYKELSMKKHFDYDAVSVQYSS